MNGDRNKFYDLCRNVKKTGTVEDNNASRRHEIFTELKKMISDSFNNLKKYHDYHEQIKTAHTIVVKALDVMEKTMEYKKKTMNVQFGGGTSHYMEKYYKYKQQYLLLKRSI